MVLAAAVKLPIVTVGSMTVNVALSSPEPPGPTHVKVKVAVVPAALVNVPTDCVPPVVFLDPLHDTPVEFPLRVAVQVVAAFVTSQITEAEFPLVTFITGLVAIETTGLSAGIARVVIVVVA